MEELGQFQGILVITL